MARGVKRLLKILLVLILLGAIAYVSIVLMVCWKETHVAAPGKDYEAMLVLGAQVKPDGTPSLQLQWRLEKAAETYRQKKVPVVVCGGQGGTKMRSVLENTPLAGQYKLIVITITVVLVAVVLGLFLRTRLGPGSTRCSRSFSPR